MSADIIDFPGTELDVCEREVNDLHAEAFRNLEGKISDCALMAHIAVQMAEPFINSRDDRAERALFAVCHVYQMLKKLNADYEADFYGEQRGAS